MPKITPRCSAKICTGSVFREGIPLGTSVVKVSATDQEEGFNAEITYSFLGVANKAQHMFSLDSATVDVITHQALDFEEVERHTLDVEAKDRGSLSTQCNHTSSR